MSTVTTTDELTKYFDALGYHDPYADPPDDPPYWGFARPTFWEQLQIELEKLGRQEIRRFVATWQSARSWFWLTWATFRFFLLTRL